MGFRTVVIKNRAKLDYKLNYLVCRGEVETRIYIPEISVLIVESTGVSLTAVLLAELVKNKVKVVFCDEKHLPHSQLVGMYDNYHSSARIKEQINWDPASKGRVWKNIVENKICNQYKLLQKYGRDEAELFAKYMTEVEDNDITNREGHSAKVYFNALFGNVGRRVPTFFNSALNYGYSILLSAFCREVTSSGYLTQLGIWHTNEFNFYNLACDLMEPYRVIVDDLVLSLDPEALNFKAHMANVVNSRINIAGKNVYLETAVEIYCRSVFGALQNGDADSIRHFSNYELPIYENNCDV